MVFDVGNGLSIMGGAVSKTAGDYLLANQKSELEDQSTQLAHSLAMQRQTQQQGFQTDFEKNVKQPFEKSQTTAQLASEEKRTSMNAGATLGAASISAAASRYHSDALERMEAAKSAEDLEKTKMIWGTRSTIENNKLDVVRTKLDSSLLSDKSPTGPDGQPQVGADGKPLLSPLIGAIDQYIDTGKMPLQGGFGSQQQRTQISAGLAGRLAERGLDPTKMREMWGTKQAAQKDLDNQIKQGGQLANYSQTLDKNIDAAVKLITEDGKVDPTGSPLLNKWVTATEKDILGDPNLTVLDQQLRLVATEAAKLNTGQLGIGGLPEGAREEYNKILNIAKTRGQLEGLFGLLKADAQRRMSSQDTQIREAQHALQTGGYTPYSQRGGETAPPLAGTKLPPAQVGENQPAATPPLPRNDRGAVDVNKMRAGDKYALPNGNEVIFHPETPDTPFWPVPKK